MFQSTGNNLLIKKKLQRPFDSLLLVLLASKLIDSEKKRFPMAAIYSLYIINKSGGLIFYKVPSLFSLLSASLIENQEYFYWKKKYIFFFWKNKDYGSAGRMDTNDSLRVASLWHSMHAISQQLSPTTGCSGIELLEADTFDLHCFQSLTGIFSLSLIA